MDKIVQYLNESPTIFFIYRKKENWTLEYVTNNVINVFGFSAEDILSKKENYLDSIHKDDFKAFQSQAHSVLREQKEEFHFKPYRVVDKNKVSWISQISKAIKNEQGEVDQIYGYLTDVSQQIQVEQDLQNYINIVNDNVLISISDTKGEIIDCSNAFCQASGYTKEELIGQKHNILRHKDSEDIMFQEMWGKITNGQVWHGEHKNMSKNGNTFWVENSITPSTDQNNDIIKYTSIYNDITHKKEISQLLITDYLTKIHNRRYFNEIFDLEIKRSKRHDYNFILMIIDIDYFKQYNDTYGHQKGDKALINVAQKLKKSLNRPEDYTFRIGGEEFGIITSDINLYGAKSIANRLLKEVRALQIEHTNSKILEHLSISIGLKLVRPKESLSYSEIYSLADEALYEAKESGRNRVICSQ